MYLFRWNFTFLGWVMTVSKSVGFETDKLLRAVSLLYHTYNSQNKIRELKLHWDIQWYIFSRLNVGSRVSHSISEIYLFRRLRITHRITYTLHMNKVAHFYLNASRTKILTFHTSLLYFEFRILRYCRSNPVLDCLQSKQVTLVIQFQSFALRNKKSTLTTTLPLPTFTVVATSRTHTVPITRLSISHSQLHERRIW